MMDNDGSPQSSNLKRCGSFSSDDEDLNDTESKKRLKVGDERSDSAGQENSANKSCLANLSKQNQLLQNDHTIKEEAPECSEDSKPNTTKDTMSENEQAKSRR